MMWSSAMVGGGGDEESDESGAGGYGDGYGYGRCKNASSSAAAAVHYYGYGYGYPSLYSYCHGKLGLQVGPLGGCVRAFFQLFDWNRRLNCNSKRFFFFFHPQHNHHHHHHHHRRALQERSKQKQKQMKMMTMMVVVKKKKMKTTTTTTQGKTVKTKNLKRKKQQQITTSEKLLQMTNLDSAGGSRPPLKLLLDATSNEEHEEEEGDGSEAGGEHRIRPSSGSMAGEDEDGRIDNGSRSSSRGSLGLVCKLMGLESMPAHFAPAHRQMAARPPISGIDGHESAPPGSDGRRLAARAAWPDHSRRSAADGRSRSRSKDHEPVIFSSPNIVETHDSESSASDSTGSQQQQQQQQQPSPVSVLASLSSPPPFVVVDDDADDPLPPTTPVECERWRIESERDHVAAVLLMLSDTTATAGGVYYCGEDHASLSSPPLFEELEERAAGGGGGPKLFFDCVKEAVHEERAAWQRRQRQQLGLGPVADDGDGDMDWRRHVPSAALVSRLCRRICAWRPAASHSPSSSSGVNAPPLPAGLQCNIWPHIGHLGPEIEHIVASLQRLLLRALVDDLLCELGPRSEPRSKASIVRRAASVCNCKTLNPNNPDNVCL